MNRSNVMQKIRFHPVFCSKFESFCLEVISVDFSFSSKNFILSETPCSKAFCDDQWWPCISDMYERHPWSRQQDMVSTYMAKTFKIFIQHYIQKSLLYCFSLSNIRIRYKISLTQCSIRQLQAKLKPQVLLW